MIKSVALATLLISIFLTNGQSAAIAADNSDSLYLDAEHSYLANDIPKSLQILTEYLSLDSHLQHERTLARAHNLRGLILFQDKNLAAALLEFELAVQVASKNVAASDSTIHLARYNYANALYQSARTQDAYDALQAIDPAALDIDTRTRFFHLFGNVNMAKELYLAATTNYLNASALAKDSTNADVYAQKAFASSRKIYSSNAQSDVEAIQKISTELPANSNAALTAQVILARGFLYLGDGPKAEILLKDFLTRAPANHPLRSKAAELAGEMNKLGDVNGDTIGLLLPISGKFAKFGRLCMNAAFMALNVYEEMPEAAGAHSLKFAVRDSGDTPESAQAALEKLILEDHAIAVVGPLLSKQFTLVAQKAQELGTPLFSLSQKVDTEKLGSYIFPIALTPNQQIEMIVAHAMDKQGFKRFAILAPSDNFGEQYVQLFWNAVEARGGSIMGIERYEPKSTDFRDEIKRLLGLEYLDARNLEQDEIKRRQDIYASTLKVHGRLRERLLKSFAPQPILDFDAVFIPDDPQTVGQIAPSFAVENVDDLPMLGINTWNTNDIVQRAGHYLQKSLFVDAYVAGSQDQASTQFQEDFNKYFQAQPGTIEVQTYDAVSILKQALEAHPLNSRAKLKDQLLAMGHFHGVSGEFSFTDSGVKRSAHLLTINGNSIVEIPEGSAATE